jgi:Putative DNA-binding domain
MRSLRELQQGFARALITGVPGRDMPGIRADGLSPMRRLGFYRTNVFGNYLDGLRATYRSVENLVGRGCFAYHAERFIRETPSVSGDLNRYGGEFPDFLARASIAEQLPYLPDVARLEWLLEGVFYEADHPPLDLERLALVPAERYIELRFALHPACRLLRSAYPVRRIWQVSQPGYEGDQAVALDSGGHDLLLRRDGFDPVVEVVSAAEFALLKALHDGETLGAAGAAAGSAQTDYDIAACFQRRVADGTLAQFHCPFEEKHERCVRFA